MIAKRDPGQGFIWLGAILLVGGLTLSLLRPRRRVWARYDSTIVRLAVTGGDPFAEEECRDLISLLPAVHPGQDPAGGVHPGVPAGRSRG